MVEVDGGCTKRRTRFPDSHMWLGLGYKSTLDEERLQFQVSVAKVSMSVLVLQVTFGFFSILNQDQNISLTCACLNITKKG